MIQKSFNIFLSLFFIFSIMTKAHGDEKKIDIWKNQKNKETIKKEKTDIKKKENNEILTQIKDNKVNEVLITEEKIDKKIERKVFGIYDPAEFNFSLNMWSSSNVDDIKASIKRINKINLSNTSNEIYQNILLSISLDKLFNILP